MEKLNDEMRAGYKATDFIKLERGKFYQHVVKGTTMKPLQPAIEKVSREQSSPAVATNALPRRSD